MRRFIADMTNYKEHTHRIARNTLMLYVRMLFMMFLGLFTSRIVLEALGENDYGVYSVVGGVVAMFSVISGSLSGAISRFITFELGKGENGRVAEVYSTAVAVQLLLAIVIVLVAEPLGLWYIDNKMTIDPVRIPAARWVLHFSILSFAVNLMSMPQMATITAHEKMSAYAYIGILEGVLRFVIALAISYSHADRLVLYAMLMALSFIVVRLTYGIYCRRHFPECRFSFRLARGGAGEMFSFAGWNFVSVAASVVRDYGSDILINLFYGPAVNAARAIAVQLNGVVHGFVKNFMTAVNPQITKSYACGQEDMMVKLVIKSARFSYYLLLILVLPVIFNVDYLLGIWLKEVPEYTTGFVTLFLVFALSESLITPMVTATLATGRIRTNIIMGFLVMLNLPVSYLCLKAGAPPESTVLVAVVLSQVCLVARYLILRSLVQFSARDFFVRIYMNVMAVTAVSLVLPLIIVSCYSWDGFTGFLVKAAVCVLSVGCSVLSIGMNAGERRGLMDFITSRRNTTAS